MEQMSCRKIARQALKRTLPENIWEQNWSFIQNLRKKLSKHKMLNHPLIEQMNHRQLKKEELKKVFLNFRPLVERFTDVLMTAGVLTYQVNNTLDKGTKMYSRFLLTLNILDEMGFQPDVDHRGYYQGSPFLSHFLLYEDMLRQAQITEEEKTNFPVCEATQEILAFWQWGHPVTSHLLKLIASLVSTEMIALYFSPALRNNAEVFESIDFSSGYFYVHGSSQDESINAADDDHEDDLWYIATQNLTLEKHKTFEKDIVFFMEKWVSFWDAQMP